ncbi:hypothetical protein [Cohnella herbarum]|uniref:Uncharacterized protein n=1 Tax=Cohnella herbarum TaxID=2728023 RepID=A0A7Z2VL76_9BACL|nr:hypothetical protein [Cohnella herbarum]QJD85138.1 hypothetical protein HH215_19485 [Cohnella herbarum]
MDKERYYVSVSTYMVGKEPSLTDQFIVLATEDERNHLLALLSREQQAMEQMYIREQLPYKSADYDKMATGYNGNRTEIYRYIYKIGTIETKRHIEYMDVLPQTRTRDNPRERNGTQENGKSK